MRPSSLIGKKSRLTILTEAKMWILNVYQNDCYMNGYLFWQL
jgi:hypothetical protein